MPTFSFVLSHEQFPVPELVQLGTAAEKAGFDGIWTSDHFQPWQNNQGHAGFAWITLAALTQHTSKLIVGTGVTCPTYRYHPSIVAEAFASLGLLAPGRVFLGVGTGEALNEAASGSGFGDYAERAERLKEAVTLIRRLWTGETVNYTGQYYQIDKARLYDLPAQPIPIYIAAEGPKSFRMAGEFGDGLITDSERAVDPKLRGLFEEGARSAGKDPATMPVLAEHMVYVGTPDEAKKDAELWRFMPKAWSHFVTDPDPEHIHEEADKLVDIDQLVQKWAVGPDPQTHIQKIRMLLEKGVTQVYIHSPQQDQQKVIDFYAREVLPQVRAVGASR